MDAKKVSTLRKRLGLTQAEMARAIGSSTMVISHWENGFRVPQAITARFLSLLYSLSDSELARISKRLQTLSEEDSDA